MAPRLAAVACLLACSAPAAVADLPDELEIPAAQLDATPVSFLHAAGDSGRWTWWLPAGARRLVLPISAGMVADASQAELMGWLRRGSPWGLSQLPALGAVYGDRTLVVVVPWPHYAELVIAERDGLPPRSATVAGAIELRQQVYTALAP